MNFKTKHLLLFFVLAVVSCSKEPAQQLTSEIVMSKNEVYNFITSELARTNKAFDWNTASDALIYAAGEHSDAVFSIGYQPAGFTNLKDRIHQIDLNEKSWVDARIRVENTILAYEKRNRTEDGISILAPTDQKFPHVYAVIKNKELITKLRAMSEVRFGDKQ
jgi:serine protease